jgi:hypothetical protein
MNTDLETARQALVSFARRHPDHKPAVDLSWAILGALDRLICMDLDQGQNIAPPEIHLHLSPMTPDQIRKAENNLLPERTHHHV